MGYFLKVVLAIVIMQSSAGAQNLMKVKESGNKIPEYIRDLIKDFNKKDLNIHDVVILNLKSKRSEFNLNQMIMEIPVENAVLLPKIGTRLDDTHLRPASFVIIIADKFNMSALYSKVSQSFESNYFLNTAKFIFIGTKPMSGTDLYQITLLFVYIGAFNVVVLSEQNDNLIINALSLGPIKMSTLEYDTDINYVYPQNRTSLSGYTHKALAFAQKPRLYKLPNGEYHGIDVKFMQTVAEKQNAKFNITHYFNNKNETVMLKIYNHAMSRKLVGIAINTAVTSLNAYTLKTFKSVNTFDVNGFCAMIPYPPRTSFIGQMLTPFDFYTWIVFIVTFGICIVIWKMFNLIGNGREDSAMYFMFGIIAHFFLQSIPFRNNRIIQRSLLQICIFMTFILGNAYQSLIISFISESRYGATIKTFDELMQSNYSLKVDSLFYYMINLTGSMVIDKMHLIDNIVNDIDYQQVATNNTAIVLRCDVAEYIMYADEYDSHAIDYFYLLSDQMYSYYESFTTSKFSPHHEQLQYYSSLIFESGIRQHWKEFYKYKDIRGKIETNMIVNEEYLIDFDDLFGVFYVLLFGFICATLALLFEISWHGCLRHLNFKIIREYIMNEKKDKMKVRRIQVKPMESIEEETKF